MNDRGIADQNNTWASSRDRRTKRLVVALLGSTILGYGVANAPIIAPANAQQATRTVQFSIPSQSLSAAVDAFSRVTGWQVGYSSDIARSTTTRAVSGTMTPAQALQTMVAGTGVSVSITGPASAALVSSAANAASGGGSVAGAISLDTIDVQGANPNSTMSLTPVYAGGQIARGGQLGILGNKDMMNTPFNQTVYTRKLIEDQQARNLGDVLANDPSVVKLFDAGGGADHDQWSIRGIGTGAQNVAFGGLYGVLSGKSSSVALEMVERVEVLKGASALLSGLPPIQMVSLGTINLVPKRAGDEPLTTFTPDYAMNSQFGGHLDVGRRFGDNKEFGVRFNGVYRDGDTPIDHYGRETRLATLGLDYRGENVRLSADLGYHFQESRGFRQMLSVASTAPVPKPPANTDNWWQPWQSSKTETMFATARGEWDINDSLTAYAAFGRSREVGTYKDLFVSVTDAAGTMPASSGFAYGEADRIQTTTAEAGLRGRVQTGPVNHALALAVGWANQSYAGNYVESAIFQDSNLYKPVRIPEPDFSALGDPKDAPLSSRNENLGFALADTMSTLNERIQLMLGVRHQKVKQTAYYVGGSQYDESALSPAAALIVKPWENVSLYANYMQALAAGEIAPSDSVNAGEVFAPYKTTQYEVGAKVDFGRVAATLAAFTTTQPTYARNPDTFVFGETGKTRYQGIELTAFGQVTERVRFLSGITFLDPRLVETPDGTDIGNRTSGQPRYRATLGVEWDTPFVDGLTLGATGQWQSSTYLDNANTQKVDGWYRLDLNARYTIRQPGWKPIIVRASVRNVLDGNRWTTSTGGYLGLSEPRTFVLSTTFQF